MTYQNTINPEQKKKLTAIFETLCVATQEFCEERAFSETWAWQYADINKKPAWLSEVEKPQSGTDTDSDTGTDTDTGTDADSDNNAGTDSDTNTSTDTGNSIGTDIDIDSTSTGSGSSSDSDNQDDMKMRNAEDSPADAGSANNSDTKISEVMDKLTLNGEPIIFKRKVFKNFQFLV